MWKQYFKVIKIVPGPVIIPGYGKIDFASDKLPLALAKSLFENDCPYLEITPLGLKELYKVEPEPEHISEPEYLNTETPEHPNTQTPEHKNTRSRKRKK